MSTSKKIETYALETSRLILRQWRLEDYAEFARMNADPEVMRHFPNLLNRRQSDALTDKFANLIAENGWGFWVTERKGADEFIGLVGLNLADDLPLSSCIEVGWRLDRPFWGKGFATEAATAALHFAFAVLEQDHVCAFTTVGNSNSKKVMDRLGMVDTQCNFLHPKVPADSDLREHAHYDIRRERFYQDYKADSVAISKQ